MSQPGTITPLDPRAYLERIYLPDEIDLDVPKPSLALLQTLHKAHMLAVPFENLSIHYGEPIVLGDEALFDKIVRHRRGGFCYELNGLFAWLLRRLGYTVTLLSARVAEADGGFTPEFDHMALLVHDVEGADWLADVGFGDSFLLPLRMETDAEQDGGDGHRYRLHHERAEAAWLMQLQSESGWDSHYRFSLQPHVMSDFEQRCQFQQTSPESHFTQKRVCSLPVRDGRITLSDLRYITTLHGKREERLLTSEAEFRRVLAEQFVIIL